MFRRGQAPPSNHRHPADRSRRSIRGRRRHFLGGQTGMKVSIWGTRGSLASPGKDMARYGGNTSCVQVENGDGTVLVLDAGTGIRPLGAALPQGLKRVDVLLT